MAITALEIRPEEIGRFDLGAVKARKARLWNPCPAPRRAPAQSIYRKPVTVPAPIDRSIDLYQAKDRMFDSGAVGALSTVSGRIPPRPDMAWILRVVAKAHGFTPLNLRSATRNKHVVAARHEFFWLARTYTARSYPEIGRFLGGIDHTTVLHGFRKIEAMRKTGARKLLAHAVIAEAYEQWRRATNSDAPAAIVEG